MEETVARRWMMPASRLPLSLTQENCKCTQIARRKFVTPIFVIVFSLLLIESKNVKRQLTDEQKAKARERYLAYAAANPDKILEAKRRYAKKHADVLKEKQRVMREQNREMLRLRQQEYRKNNPEAIKANSLRHRRKPEFKEKVKKYSEVYYLKNKERILKRGKEYCQKNRAKVARCRRKYLDANPHKAREYSCARRMRLLGGTSKLEIGKANQLVKEWGKLESLECAYCGCPLTSSNFQVDHIIPIARGGTHSVQNIVVACRSCNSSKGAKFLFSEWVPPNLSNH
jgi:5-methylcytosine-specific restriction endonuclease McrA